VRRPKRFPFIGAMTALFCAFPEQLRLQYFGWMFGRYGVKGRRQWRHLGLVALIVCLVIPQVHAQTVQLPPWSHQQFLSSAGVPLAGACIGTFAAGTTTPLATFTDSTGLTPNANPTIADAGGFVNLWLQSGAAYKFIVTSAGGVNCASGTLQWTLDGITVASSSSSGTATALTSAGANPATSGVVRLAKGEGVCWRNNGNSANLCMSPATSAPVDQLIWPQGILLTEIAAPTGLAGSDLFWADSTAHRLKQSGNGGSAAQLVNAGVDVNTSDQVTSTHLSSALPVLQGGTGTTTSAGSGSVILASSNVTTVSGVSCTIGSSCSAFEATLSAPALATTDFLNTGLVSATGKSYLGLAHTAVRMYATYNVTMTGCSGNATFALYDFTASSTVTSLNLGNASAGTNVDSGVISVAMTAGHIFGFNDTSATTGCSGGVISLTATYQ
jgi:hypothetical protein